MITFTIAKIYNNATIAAVFATDVILAKIDTYIVDIYFYLGPFVGLLWIAIHVLL